MNDRVTITELTDVDRFLLEEEFQKADLLDKIEFEEPSSSLGSAGILDPLSATVIITGMALTVLAIWICRENRRVTKIQKKSTNEVFEITTNETMKCKSDVLAQLVKIFPSVVISTSGDGEQNKP